MTALLIRAALVGITPFVILLIGGVAPAQDAAPIPVTEQPAAESPAVESPAVEQFVAEDPAVESPVAKDPVDAPLPDAADDELSKAGLRFSFDRSPWRAVLEWLADESELALHVSELPQGTFTYSDPNYYTPVEAINRINLFLIPEGFSVVRSGSLLAVISLNDSLSLQQLDAMARLISVDQLDELGDYDVVKCLLPLGSVSPSVAAAELKQMQLIAEPIVLPSSNQLMIIETAGKLKSICSVLDAMQATAESEKQVVETFQLKYLLLEDFMEAARPHLGIEADQLSSDQISISTDSSNQKLYVSGTTESVQLLSDLITVIDKSENAPPTAPPARILRSHIVRDDNLQSVYDVLQTLLADQPIRLSVEPATNSIVALAEPSVQEKIQETIVELEGVETEFVIVELNNLEPRFAISLLDEMFDIFSEESSGKRGVLKIDADPTSRRLFIRGQKARVAEIQQVVEQLDSSDRASGSRIVPLYGSRAQRVLEEAKESWGGENPVHDVPGGGGIRAAISERVVSDPDTLAAPEASRDQEREDSDDDSAGATSFVSAPTISLTKRRAKRAPISAQVTSRGIEIRSDNEVALTDFESHLRQLATSDTSTAVQTVVYYLKYSTADEATRLLADLLDGATSVVDSSIESTLVNGGVESFASAGLLGSYLRSNDGATMVSSGTLTVLADARLNRLICLGTQEDLALIEQYLEVLDRDESLTAIETHGVSHVIELQHTKAEEIAEVIRDAYGDRVAMSSKERIAQQAQKAAAKEKGGARSEGENKVQTSHNQEPQLTLAVHEQSNTLVVTAPEPLYLEIESLVRKLDEQGAQVIEVIWYPDVDRMQMLKDALSGNGDSQSSNGGRRNERSR